MSDPFRWAKCLIKLTPGYGQDGDWLPTDRIVPVSFRSEAKGLGAGQLRVLKSDSVDGNEQNFIFLREVIIYDGRGVDSSTITDLDSALGRIIFRGFVRKPTLDCFENSPEKIGVISVDEFGLALSQKPIIYEQDFPEFNPEYNGVQYGNYNAGNFRNSDFVKRGDDGHWIFPEEESDDPLEQEYIWNRKRMIEWFVSRESWLGDITWPWESRIAELQAAANTQISAISDNPDLTSEEKSDQIAAVNENLADQSAEVELSYFWFFDYDIPPISNYDGSSIQEALGELIPDTMDWFFDHNASSSSADLIIYNKVNVALPGIQPAGVPTNFNLPPATDVFNLTIHSDEVYDRVRVRGKPILWCGSVTLWDVLSDATLQKDWSQEDEDKWLRGRIEVPGGSELDDEVNSEIIRRLLDRVFQRFKWSGSGIPAIGARSGNFGDNEEGPVIDKKAFFGSYFGIDLDTNTGDKDVVTATHFIDTTLSNHKTPNKLAQVWEDFLPFIRYDDKFAKEFPLQLQFSLETDRLAEPFVICPTANLLDSRGSQQSWLDRSLPFGSASSIVIEFYEDGIWLRREVPQTDLHDIDEMWQLQQEGPIRSRVSLGIDLLGDDVSNLELNPNDDAYVGKSNYNRFIITIAGRSRERLEGYKTRKNIDGKDVQVEKEKVIDVEDCEIWCVHSNTVRNLTAFRSTEYSATAADGSVAGGESNRSNMGNTPIRFRWEEAKNEFNKTGVHVLRDDRQKLVNWLNAYSNLLMTPRAEMNLVIALDFPVSIGIGSLIGDVNDVTRKYTINSAVQSMEWTFENGPARLSVNTYKPEVSLFTRAMHEAEEAKGVRPQNSPELRNARIIR